jgi:hypothetical protein
MMPMPQLQQRLCAPCLIARVQWENAHRPDLEKMIAAVREAQETGQPLPVADPSELLPEALRPGQPGGMPSVQPSATTVQGTEFCVQHLPGMPGSRPPLLIAQGALTSAAMSQMAGPKR